MKCFDVPVMYDDVVVSVYYTTWGGVRRTVLTTLSELLVEAYRDKRNIPPYERFDEDVFSSRRLT